MNNNNHNNIELLCGPVIGKVTTTTARILIELKNKAVLTLLLTPVNSEIAKKIKKSKIISARTPTVYEFKDLIPGCQYNVSFVESYTLGEGVPELRKCQFRTLPTGFPEKLKFAVVACNSIYTEFKCNPKYSLWSDLASKIEEFDYVFHNGDQVYLDDGAWEAQVVMENAYMILKGKYEKVNFRDYQEDIREYIRGEYRKIYNYPPIAHILRNAPNFMILDDHEIADDFGFKESFMDKTTFDHFYSEQARYVYYQYQRQLRENIEFSDFSGLGGEYYIDNIAGVGVFFLDYRGCRTWNKIPGDELKLGKQQWNDLEACFGEGGLFSNDDVKSVLIFSATALVFLPNDCLTRLAAKHENDVYEQWSMDCPEEQARLLRLLIDFKFSSGKEVAVISGDIHMRGFTDIKFNNEIMLKQFITSGISIKTATEFQMLAMRLFIELDETLEGGFTYEHSDFERFNNYGVIDVLRNELMDYDMFATHHEACESQGLLPTEVKRYPLKAEFRKTVYNKLKKYILEKNSGTTYEGVMRAECKNCNCSIF
jgi:hypothetical protein